MPTPYDINPAPRTGRGTYGMVPGALGLPNPAGDLASQFPGLARTNQAASDAIFAGLEGQLSPGTLNALQDANAAFGVTSGMPGMTGFNRNRLGRNIGLTAEGLSNQALANYSKIIPTISGTQTVNPALQTQIASENALFGAAPDPAAAQSHAEALFQQYLQQMRGPGGGTRIAGGGGGGGGRDSLGFPLTATGGGGGPNEFVGNSTGTATMYGGVPFYGGQTPETYQGAGPIADMYDPGDLGLVGDFPPLEG